MTNRLGCLRYWDLCSTLPIDAAVALWCGAEPSELAKIGLSIGCMDAKREAIIDALRGGRLEYEGTSVPRSDGRGMWHGAPLIELIDKNGVRIKKESLRRWFLDMPINDRPDFLFDEARQEDSLPDGGDVAEMNSMRALAVMAYIMSTNKSVYAIGDDQRPNAAAIARAVEPLAQRTFGYDTRGFASFQKKLGRALKLLADDVEAGAFGSHRN